jgi:hypothetical protein
VLVRAGRCQCPLRNGLLATMGAVWAWQPLEQSTAFLSAHSEAVSRSSALPPDALDEISRCGPRPELARRTGLSLRSELMLCTGCCAGLLAAQPALARLPLGRSPLARHSHALAQALGGIHQPQPHIYIRIQAKREGSASEQSKRILSFAFMCRKLFIFLVRP